MKKITSFLMVFVVCAFVQSQNLALNGTASASSNLQPASNAIDGNGGTRWESAFSDPQWITIDLGTSYQIGQVVLNWEGAFASTYEIQISDDSTFSTYTTLFNTTSGNGNIDDLTVNGTGRYVRMYGTVRGTPYGYSLWEFSIYEALDPVTIATLSDLTVNGTTVAGFASSVYNYNVLLPIGTTVVPTVIATTSQAGATAVVTNAPSLPGTTSVFVTAQNGTDTQMYTINFTAIIAPVNQTFDLTFESGTAGSNPLFWNVFENGNNPPLQVVDNPNASGVNTSAKVAKMTTLITQTGVAPYAGCETVHGNIWEWELVNGYTTTITIDVYKTVISDVGIKMVTASSGTVFQLLKPNTVINAWETLTYDISNLIVGNGENHNIDQIVVFPDWQEPRTTENITYFDNISWEGLKLKEAQPVLGVLNFETIEVKIYPNPTQNVWNIISNNQILKSVQVYDVLGKLVISQNPNSNEVSIDASSLPKGLYFAKISTETGSKSTKLIKK